MIFSRNRKKGDGDNDKDRDRPKRAVPAHLSGAAQQNGSEFEYSFPLLKRIASNRGIIPVLVMISLMFGMIIASMLLRQAPSGGWEAPVQKTTDAAPAARKATTASLNVVQAIQSSEPEGVPTRVPVVTSIIEPLPSEDVQTSAPSKPAVIDKLVGEATDRAEVAIHQRPAATADPADSPNDSEAAPTTRDAQLSPAPPTQTPASSPTEPQETVEPIRGIQWFSYAHNGIAHDVTAFPMVSGLFLFSQVKPKAAHKYGHEFVDHGNHTQSKYPGLNTLVRSRYACMCADTHIGAATFQKVASALEQSLTDATALVTNQRAPRVPAPTGIKYLPVEGRYSVLLGDGHRLETRVMPCNGVFYASAALALCDPAMNSSTVMDETDEPTAAPQGSQKRNQRPQPKPAMVPVGPCSALDEESAADVLDKRLYIPSNDHARSAFIAAAAAASAAKKKTKRSTSEPVALSTATPYFYSTPSEDQSEISAMCDQCGAEPKPQALEGGQPDTRFHDPQRFRPIFFERERHPLLINALRSIVTSSWQAVRELTRNGEHRLTKTASKATHGEAPSEGSPNISAGVESGLRAMDTLAGRCDKRGKAEHFAQCFPSRLPLKSANWSRGLSYPITKPVETLQLTPSRFFANISADFPIPSRLMLHPLNIGGHIVCYASGDMVCDIVGKTGGWENELIQIVAYAASELRKLNRQAASILAARLELRSQKSNLTAEQYDVALAASIRRHQSFHGEFSLGSLLDRNNLLPVIFLESDVTFIDVGGNVGVFATSMWKRGFRTEVFEALPHNVFLLESTRCTNQAEEFSTWEDARSSRISRTVKIAEQTQYATIKHDLMTQRNVSTVSRDEVEKVLASRRDEIVDEAVRSLSPYFQTRSKASPHVGGPWMPRFEIHHSALGNGRKGRSGDESFEFALNETLKISPDDEEIASRLNASVRASLLGSTNATEEDQECVMISEKHNFGDIVILCNESLVKEARSALQRLGSSRARVLKEYIPRGFVHLTSLDRVLRDPTENIELENIAMTQRFGALIDVPDDNLTFAATAPNTTVYDESVNATQPVASPAPSYRRRHPTPSPRAPFISTSNSTAELLEFVRYSQVVMKIDVEGQEEYVMQGAHQLLGNISIRPRLILSEIWRKMNVARYGAFMIDVHGYVGFALSDRVWLRSTLDVVRFHRTKSLEMDTIIWVLPQYQFLIPPSAFERRPVF
jgi:hypothetical protein